MRPPIAALLALLSLAAGPLPGPAAAQDGGGKGKEENPFGEEAPPPLTPEEEKEAAALFAKAKAETAKGAAGFLAARKLYQEFLKKYPGGDEDMLIEAEDRSGENFCCGFIDRHCYSPTVSWFSMAEIRSTSSETRNGCPWTLLMPMASTRNSERMIFRSCPKLSSATHILPKDRMTVATFLGRGFKWRRWR